MWGCRIHQTLFQQLAWMSFKLRSAMTMFVKFIHKKCRLTSYHNVITYHMILYTIFSVVVRYDMGVLLLYYCITFSTFFCRDLCNEPNVALAQLQWSVDINWIKAWPHMILAMVIGGASLLIMKLIAYIFLVMFAIGSGVVNKYGDVMRSFFSMGFQWCVFFYPHWTTHRSNVLVGLRKTKHPHTLVAPPIV